MLQKIHLFSRSNPGPVLKTRIDPVQSRDMADQYFDQRSHSALLSSSLQNLKLSRDPEIVPNQTIGATYDDTVNDLHPNLNDEIVNSHKADGDLSNLPVPSGSGVSSPRTAISATGTGSPAVDLNGLGWPGAPCVFLRTLSEKPFFSHSSVFQQSLPSFD